MQKRAVAIIYSPFLFFIFIFYNLDALKMSHNMISFIILILSAHSVFIAMNWCICIHFTIRRYKKNDNCTLCGLCVDTCCGYAIDLIDDEMDIEEYNNNVVIPENKSGGCGCSSNGC